MQKIMFVLVLYNHLRSQTICKLVYVHKNKDYYTKNQDRSRRD